MTSQEELPERDLFGARPGELILPEHAFPTRCESCGAEIVWQRTRRGKLTPLSVATTEERWGVKYALPHWADCPQADQWRGKP